MGASVYAVIEYKEYDSYSSFGEINLLRHNEFLCAIAWGEGGITDEMPYPPRGFPVDASYETRNSFFVDADEVKDFLRHFREDVEDETYLKEFAAEHGAGAIEEYRLSGRLPMPELTHYGWLNLEELEANLTHRGIKSKELPPPIRAALAAMTELATAYGRDGVRLVFWIGL